MTDRASISRTLGREGWLQRVRAALGEQAFRLAWDEGEAMTSDQAIAYALGPDA